MREVLLVVALLAGCGGSDDPGVFIAGPAGAGGGTVASSSSSSASGGGGAGQGGAGGAPATCSDGTPKPCADGLVCAAPEDCDGTCFAGLCRCGTPQPSLTISHVRTRGNDLVEIYNPTSVPITTDATWSLEWAPLAFPAKYTAAPLGNHTIQPGAVLVVEGPAEPTCPDVTLAAGADVPNAGSVRLRRSEITVDAVCFFSAPEEAASLADVAFSCEGEPVANASGTGNGLARAPGGAEGPCSDLGSSALDFHVVSPSVPTCD